MTSVNVKQVFEQLVENEKKIEKTVPLAPISYLNDKISLVSLFCGSGGFDLGIECAGIEAGLGRTIDIESEFHQYRDHSIFQTVYATDFAPDALKTYSKHFPDTTVQLANIRQLMNFPVADIYLFGFPCPGFSSAGPRKFTDERNYLYVHCCRALQEAQPKFFIAENVPGITTLQNGEVFKEILNDFEECNYNVYTKIVNASDHGVSQLRERMIFVGVRKDINYEYIFPKPTHGEFGQAPYVTLADSIGMMNDTSGMYYKGTYSSQYMSRNRKKAWHEQSFTIQASGRQSPLHPQGEPMIKHSSTSWSLANEQQDRRFTINEAARIQSFPSWFDFYIGDSGNHNTRVEKGFKQIGNAVPPLLGKALVKPICDYFIQK